MIRTYSDGSRSRLSPKLIVVFKILATVAVFLGGSSIAIASLSHRQARTDMSDWGGWAPPETSAEAEAGAEDSLAEEALSLLAYLAGGQGAEMTAESSSGTETKASARSTSSTKKSSAASGKGRKAGGGQPEGTGTGPGNGSGNGSAPGTSPSPAPSPSPNDPSPSPSPSPSPNDPSPSPSPTDPGLSAGPVFDAAEKAKQDGEGLFATLKGLIFGLLGLDEDPQPNEVIPTVDPSDAPNVDPSDIPTVDPSDIPNVDPSDIPNVDPSDIPTVDPSDAPTVDPSDAPDPNDYVPDHQGLLEDISGLVVKIKELIKQLLGIDADDPVGSALRKVGETQTSAERAAGEATVTATAVADAVTATVTPYADRADEIVDIVTSTAIGAAATAGAAAEKAGAEAWATATAAAEQVQDQVQEQVRNVNVPALMVGTVLVNTRDTTDAKFPVIAGHQYTFKASGRYFYGLPYGYLLADASCASTDLTQTFAKEAFPTQPGLLNLTVNDSLVEWQAVEGGECSPSHRYEVRFTATSTDVVRFKVIDPNFTDNGEDLTNLYRVEIWDMTPGATQSSVSSPMTVALLIALLLGSATDARIRRGRELIPVDGMDA